MKKHIPVGLVLALAMSAPSTAFADDAACLNAASKGQRLRATHKLVEAREKLRICAAAECPPVVQGDCAGWLASVEKALPSVVLTAKDDAGGSLIDVKVTVDGQPLVTRLDGQAIPIDPGPHTFRFEGLGGATAEQVELIPEGDQNHRVSAVLARKATRPSTPAPSPSLSQPSPPVTPATPAPAPDASASTADQGTTTTSQGSYPWKTVGWVAGGLGVVGLGVGTVFGMMAIQDHANAECNASHVCLTGPLNDAKSAATLADVGLIAGGVLAAAGIGLLVFAPSSSGTGEGHPAATALVSPILAPDGAGLGVSGAW